MDALSAKEHLDVVDDIVRRERYGSPPALQFIVCGLVGITFDLVGQFVGMHKLAPSAFLAAGAMLLLAIGVSIWDKRRTLAIAGRQTTIGRLAAVSFWSAAGVMTVLTVVNEFTNIFPPFAPAIFYAAGMSVALLALGVGLRGLTMTLGGLALLTSIVIAFFVPAWLGAILAIGNFVGFVLPGISFALAKNDG
ncbi:MAG: hypothetical protein M3Z41_10100 [Candidatus Eremiobacteraeota bacterium]|nr:hypothetical protein [Candidatus Eremiobacteraeota bacterium]